MKQYITLLLCFFTVIGFSQNKKVHLVHGLGGNSVSWSEFSDILESKCVGLETTTFFNTSNAGLDVFSEELENNFEAFGYTPSDIAIGHSFGGANLRNIDNQGYFGGYITVAAVHDGSPLANAKLNGTLEAWIENTCKEVITDPYNAISGLSPLYFTPKVFDGFFANIICGKVYEILLKLADPFVGDGQSIEDIKVGGAISSMPSASIPGIGIVCSSDGHPLWDLLDGAEDFKLPIGTYESNAKILEVSAKATSKTLELLSVISIIPLIKRKLRFASKECKESYQWMESTEAAWNELIGAGGGVSFVDVETESWICDCYNIETSEPVPCDQLGSSDQIVINDVDHWETCNDNPECFTTNITTVPSFGPDLPSDGLLPTKLQSLPGSIHEDLVTNVSHFEEPKDEGVQKKLVDHLHPLLAIRPVFKIPACL